MSIISSFRIVLNENLDRLVLELQREYPDDLGPDDRFVLERYELDPENEAQRLELREAVRSQTVLQYMSGGLQMSAAFHMVPLNAFTIPDVLTRAANFRMNPDFIDITEFIRARNSSYTDENSSRRDHLYLYRIVYQYQGLVYHTGYVAGFERISENRFPSELVGRRLYKPMVTDDTMLRLFGEDWPHLRRYFDTLMTEERTRYRQDPVVFRLPGRSFSLRFRGPLEDYKILTSYREAARQIETAAVIHQKVADEIGRMRALADTVDRRAANLFRGDERLLVQFTLRMEDLAGDDYFAVLVKDGSIARILDVTPLDLAALIPAFMKRDGVYVVLREGTAAEEIRDLLTEDRQGIDEPIFIVVLGHEEILYVLEVIYT